jgi:hypothetical protein
MTNLIVHGSICQPIIHWLGIHSNICIIRWIHELLTCMKCVGLWSGILICWLMSLHIIAPMWLSLILMGCLLSGTTWVLHCIVSALGGGYDPSITLNVLHEDISEKE